VYPAFESNIRSYEVTFYNPSKTGNIELTKVSVEYGDIATYPLSAPKKIDTTKPNSFEFTT
jgi:hypothetical protein